jgi:hypothetical protein
MLAVLLLGQFMSAAGLLAATVMLRAARRRRP